MIQIRKNTRIRAIRIAAFIMALVMLLSAVTLYFDFRLRRVVKAFARSAVKTVVIDCANRASNKALSEMQISYDTLAIVSRNAEGLATTVEINSVEANRIKSIICDEISKELAKREEVTFSVPLAAAFGIYFTSAKWPKLKYSVHITTTAVGNFKSNFVGVGINQVLHQILMTVNLECDLGMLETDTEQVTTTEFIIAQTVIVGAVPDAFTSVGHATDELMEDIFDFGAHVSN
ncbi:MAG: sporulation protein YunB [Acutalibacteraceae bacterium]|nr:sporulation protein YunB [Acutalibacteraceae bacterium]